MKTKKLVKKLKKHLNYMKKDRDDLSLRFQDLEEFEKRDLKDYNNLIFCFSEVINYFSPPQEHV